MFHLYLQFKFVLKTHTCSHTHTHTKEKSIVQMTKRGKFILKISFPTPTPSSFFRWCHLLCSLHYTSSLEHSIHNQKRGGGGHCQPNVHFLCQHTSSALPLAFSLVLLNSLLWAKIIRLNQETQLFTFMPVNPTWYALIKHNAILCKMIFNQHSAMSC